MFPHLKNDSTWHNSRRQHTKTRQEPRNSMSSPLSSSVKEAFVTIPGLTHNRGVFVWSFPVFPQPRWGWFEFPVFILSQGCFVLSSTLSSTVEEVCHELSDLTLSQYGLVMSSLLFSSVEEFLFLAPCSLPQPRRFSHEPLALFLSQGGSS